MKGIYRANSRSVLQKLDSGDGREDQPVVGGVTAVAPRATYTTTPVTEREITNAVAYCVRFFSLGLSGYFASLCRKSHYRLYHAFWLETRVNLLA